MAKAATPKQPRKSQNTSAPATPGNAADVSAQEAAKSASQASTQTETGTTAVSESTATPPAGEAIPEILPPVDQEPVRFAITSAPQDQQQGEPEVTHIIVTAKKEGFRRAGRAWSKTPATVPIDEFTDRQIDALVMEPMLDITFLAE